MVSKAPQQIRALVRRARYGEAFKLAKKFYTAYPHDPEAQYAYAAMLSDNCYGISKKLLEKRKTITLRLLRNLIAKLKNTNPGLKMRALNEYYWFSEAPKKQWAHGMTEVKKGNWRAYYSVGVGAAMCAYKSHLAGKRAEALMWARKGQTAWRIFFKNEATYYNAWSFYARCLGFAGDLSGMEKALKRAARLCGRSLKYPEFQKVRKEVREALY